MRSIIKSDIDSNTKKVEILEDGVSIVTIAPPSVWAFKNNTITEIEEQLSKLNKPALTNDEKSQVQSWMDEV